MASIRERTDQDGNVSYQAQVRIHGYPPRSATFLRKNDAKKWAVQTETEIRTGMHIRQSQAGRHTAKEMLEKYKDEKLGDKAGKGKDQRTQVNWWIEQIGDYALSNVNVINLQLAECFHLETYCLSGWYDPSMSWMPPEEAEKMWVHEVAIENTRLV